jgi:hypothetical protein
MYTARKCNVWLFGKEDEEEIEATLDSGGMQSPTNNVDVNVTKPREKKKSWYHALQRAAVECSNATRKKKSLSEIPTTYPSQPGSPPST